MIAFTGFWAFPDTTLMWLAFIYSQFFYGQKFRLNSGARPYLHRQNGVECAKMVGVCEKVR